MNRVRNHRLATMHILAAGALAGTLGLSAPAHAEDWKVMGSFGYFGVGKAYQIEKGHIYFVGEFGGTFFNDKGKGSLFNQAGVKCPAFNDLDFNNKKGKAGGYCIIADPAGDQAYLTWQCEGTAITCQGTFEYTGGTGKYQGISGKNTFAADTEVNWPDGTASGYATWNR
jgi:hypothetical protein